MEKLTIKQCEQTDVEKITHLQPQGWEDITYYFRFYCKQTFCYPIMAIYDNKIAGVANGIITGKTGWLSHIIVSHDYRRKGFGNKLTQHIIDYLNSQGCKTQLLIATEMGEKLYEKLGFKKVSSYCFFRGSKLNIKVNDENIRPLIQPHFEPLLQIDREISGEDRRQMLESFNSKGWGYFDIDSQELTGYYLSDIGEGLVIAKDATAGTELLNLKHSLKEYKAVLPDENEDGKKFLTSNGFQNYSKASRMILGEEIKWKPNLVFSRIGGFYG
jgi:GNAT superfamily N-acetyltransferase